MPKRQRSGVAAATAALSKQGSQVSLPRMVHAAAEQLPAEVSQSLTASQCAALRPCATSWACSGCSCLNLIRLTAVSLLLHTAPQGSAEAAVTLCNAT